MDRKEFYIHERQISEKFLFRDFNYLRFGEYFVSIVEAQDSSQSQEEADGEAGGWMVHAMYFSMGLQHD